MQTATATQTPTPMGDDFDYRRIPIELLSPSPLNPRKTINPAKQAKLEDSVREKGVMENLVVREDPHTAGRFEIVAGERRFMAAKATGKTSLPCSVRVLSDAEVIEHALTENHQRDDVHALEEAAAIEQLMGLDAALTPQGVATKIGVSKSWVYGRLKLLKLTDEAKAAYRANALTPDHADQLAGIYADQQPAALRACFLDALYEMPTVDFLPDIDQAMKAGRWDLLVNCLCSAAELRKWIRKHTTISIDDPDLQADFPEMTEWLKDREEEEATEGAEFKATRLSDDDALTPREARALNVLPRSAWIEIDERAKEVPGRVSNERCEAMQDDGLVVHPRVNGTVRPVIYCTKRSCPTHRPAQQKQSKDVSPQLAEQLQREEEQRQQSEAIKAEQRRVWDTEERPRYLAELAARVAKMTTVTPALVRSLLEDFHIKDITTYYGLPLTTKTAQAFLILALGPPRVDAILRADRPELQEFGAAFGLTPMAWLKQQKAAAKSAKSAKKQATEKPARKAKKKGGRR